MNNRVEFGLDHTISALIAAVLYNPVKLDCIQELFGKNYKQSGFFVEAFILLF